MEQGQSPEGKDIDTEFHSDSKSNNEKSTRTSTDRKESLKGKAYCLHGTSEQNENTSQHSLHSNTEKLAIECKDIMPGKSNRNCFNETGLERKGNSLPKLNIIVSDETAPNSKDESTSISSPINSDESASENKANFAQVSIPLFFSEDPSKGKDNLTPTYSPTVSDVTCLESDISSLHEFISIASEAKFNYSGTSNLFIPNESVLESKASLTQTSSLEISDETGLHIKIGSLQISDPVSLKATATERNTDWLPLSNFILPIESASENSPLPLADTFIFENASRNSKSLSSEGTQLSFKLPEKSTRNKRRKQKNAVRKQRSQLQRKDNQTNAFDFKAFSLTQTRNMAFENKYNCEISGSMVPEENTLDLNVGLSQIPRSTVLNVNASECNIKLADQSKSEVSDETSSDKHTSSFLISSYVNPEEHASYKNSSSHHISKPINTDERNSLNSIFNLKTGTRIDSILPRDSSQKNNSVIKSPEGSVTKSNRKRKRAMRKENRLQSCYTVSKNEGNDFRAFSPKDSFEMRSECIDKVPLINRYFVTDETAFEITAFNFDMNRFEDLDEDTLRNLWFRSSDCLSWLPNVSENFPKSKDATNLKKEIGNLKESEPSLENSLLNHQNDISEPSTSQISQSAKLRKQRERFQMGKNINNRDNSKLKANPPEDQDNSIEHNQYSCNFCNNSNLNRRDLPLMDLKTRSLSTTSDQHESICFELNSKYFELPLSKTPLEINSFVNAENLKEIKINLSRTDSNDPKNSDTSRNRYHFNFGKACNNETNRTRSQEHSSQVDNTNEDSLEIKTGSFQISNNVNIDETASENTGSLPISNLMISGESASKISPLPLTGTLIYENSLRNVESLFYKRNELFKLPVKSKGNRREQKNAVRKQKYQLPPKNSQNKAYDFQAFSITQTKSIPFESKSSSIQISDSMVPEEITLDIKESLGQIFSFIVPGETTLDIKDDLCQILNSVVPVETISDIKDSFCHISSSTVLDATASKINENLTNKFKPEISDTTLENELSSFHTSSSARPDEPASDKNSNSPHTFRPTFSDDGYSLSSVFRLETDACSETNGNMSQSKSSKIDENEMNKNNCSEWWTLFSVYPDESSDIWDIAIAMFLQLLVFTFSEYIYEFFDFIFFLLLILIAGLCILFSPGFIFYYGPFHSL